MSACNKDSLVLPPGNIPPEIQSISAPDTVWTQSDYEIPVTVTVESSGSDLVELSGVIRLEESSDEPIFFNLYNDGTHGDDISGDKVYPSVIVSSELESLDGDGILNTPPVFILETGADSLSITSGSVTVITVSVSDDQGVDDIAIVMADLYPPLSPVPTISIDFHDDGSGNDLVGGDGVFTANLSSGIGETTGPGMNILYYSVPLTVPAIEVMR